MTPCARDEIADAEVVRASSQARPDPFIPGLSPENGAGLGWIRRAFFPGLSPGIAALSIEMAEGV